MFPEYTDIISNIDWNKLQSTYDWVDDMSKTEQDKIWHQEGNVFIHTKMVVEALLRLDDFKNASEENKIALFVGALMHDIEKRSTTKEESGRIVSPGHAKKGESTTRQILYTDFGLPLLLREKITKIVRHHGLPLWIFEKENPQKSIIEASLVSDTNLLSTIAKADVLGRICDDQEDLLYKIELFKLLATENNCFGESKKFISPTSKFHYFQKEDIYSDYNHFDDTKFEVIVMCGIPGSGKDYFIKHNLPDYPVLSLDKLRLEAFKKVIKPDDEKGNGQAIQLAKETAKEYMRKKQSFIWNGVNATKQIRQQVIGLCTEYGGYVKVIYLEVPYKKVLHQNKNREHPIREDVLHRFIGKLEIPSPSEAHEVKYFENGIKL